MAYSMPYRWGPGDTPEVLRWLIIISSTLTLLSALTHNLFVNFLHILSLEDILGLSRAGFMHYFLWQPVTYVLVMDSTQGVNLFFLLALFFNMYILWILGSTLYERIGKHVIGVYFACAILSGFLMLALLFHFRRNDILTGPTTALLGTFMVWTMCNPDSELMLFFVLPIQTKWLLAGVVGIICLVSLSQANFIEFVYYSSGIVFGYLYASLVLGLKGPFPTLKGLDGMLFRLRESVRNLKGNKSEKTSSKIIDINSREAYRDDDAFVDAMLAKILKSGENSLTKKERERMDKIANKKT